MRGSTLAVSFAAALSVVFVVLGCSRLPEAAAPKLAGVFDSASVDSSDVTRYRLLTREDFKSTAPPPEFAAIADRVGAATCTQVSTSPDTRVVVTEHRTAKGTSEFRARVVTLSFFAVMNRNCSWWNDERAAFSPGYVLEHEQIHFALTEIIARRLNAQAAEDLANLQFSAKTRREAFERAQDAITERLREGSEVMLAENRDFDEETSMGHQPRLQRKWLTRVDQELRRTEAWARR